MQVYFISTMQNLAFLYIIFFYSTYSDNKSANFTQMIKIK